MEDLKTLIKIVKPKALRKDNTTIKALDKNAFTKDYLLFEGIISGKFQNDSQAAQCLFSSSASHRNYRNAKRKLKEKLMDQLFFLNYEKPEISMYQKTRYQSHKQLNQCEILFIENADQIALKELEAVIGETRKNEHYDLLVRALSLKMRAYSKIGKASVLPILEIQLLNANHCFNDFLESEKYYLKAIANFNKSLHSARKIIDQIRQHITIIEEKAKKHESLSIQYYADGLKLLEGIIRQDLSATIEMCYTIEKKYIAKGSKYIKVNIDPKYIITTKVKAYLLNGQVSKGQKYIEKRLNFFSKHCNDWLEVNSTYFLLSMHALDFKKASEVFLSFKKDSIFKSLNSIDKTLWEIRRCYLLYFNETKLLKWGFDKEKFLNSPVETLTNIKAFKMSILTIRFLHQLREVHIKKLRKTFEQLCNLSDDHLDAKANYRFSIFVRMIGILIKMDFNHDRIIEKAKHYHQKLLSKKIYTTNLFNFEILPYETLWNEVLNIIKNEKQYIHFRFYFLREINNQGQASGI